MDPKQSKQVPSLRESYTEMLNAMTEDEHIAARDEGALRRFDPPAEEQPMWRSEWEARGGPEGSE